MQLPQDPYLLLSYINTKLRDEYPNLAALCEDLAADEEQLKERLRAAGYAYDAQKNAFTAK